MTKAALTIFLLLLTDVLGEDGCDRTTMNRCTNPLRVLTDNRDLGFAATERELSRLCPTLMEGMDCMNRFTLNCLKSQHRSYFNTLYAGTQRVIEDLCTPGEYQTEYLLHAPCMRHVQRGYEVCADEYHSHIDQIGPASDPSAPAEQRDSADQSARQIQQLCCSFQSYLHCSQQAVLHRCGVGTSNFTKNFLERMAGPLVQTHCANFEHGSERCNTAAMITVTVTTLLAGVLLSLLMYRVL